MRKFLIVVSLFIFLFVVTNLFLRLIYYQSIPYLLLNNQIDKNTRIVVLGSSNGEFAWNDSIIKNTKNLCLSAQSFNGCYSKLRWTLEYNDTQIDTVVLCSSLVGIGYFSDDKLDVGYEEINCLFEYKPFFMFFRSQLSYWEHIITHFSDQFLMLSRRKPYGGYKYEIHNKLDNPMVFNRINDLINEIGDEGVLTEDYFLSHCKYQLFYLRKIRDYCTQHKKKLIILGTPLYRIPDLIDDSGYKQLILHELGDSILIADYSKFEFPDSSFYRDLEHLNSRGAEYFSKHIAKNGLELKYAIDYCK